MFMESFYCYESGFTPTWGRVKSQIPQLNLIMFLVPCSPLRHMPSLYIQGSHHHYHQLLLIVAIPLQQGKQRVNPGIWRHLLFQLFSFQLTCHWRIRNFFFLFFFLVCLWGFFPIGGKSGGESSFCKNDIFFTFNTLNLNIRVTTAANEIKYTSESVAELSNFTAKTSTKWILLKLSYSSASS